MEMNVNDVRLTCDSSSTVSNVEKHEDMQRAITLLTSEVEFINSIEGSDGEEVENKIVPSLMGRDSSELTIEHNKYVRDIVRNETRKERIGLNVQMKRMSRFLGAHKKCSGPSL